MYMIMEHKWNNLDIQPPNEFVEVMDEKGNTAFAEPTYYPFKVGKSKGRKWSSPVIPCEPYWDGGWLILAKGLENTLESNIVKWKKINNKSWEHKK